MLNMSEFVSPVIPKRLLKKRVALPSGVSGM